MSISKLSNTTAAAQTAGLHIIKPTSVVVGSGTGSVADQGAVTFSGASSISLNGCFTANYSRYRLIMDFSSSVSPVDVAARFRSNGSDYTTGYYGAMFANAYNSALNTYNQINNGVYGWFAYTGSSTASTSVEIIPKSGTYPAFFFQEYSPVVAANHIGGYNLGTASSTANVDGFTIYPLSGNITGTLRVYGYNNGGA